MAAVVEVDFKALNLHAGVNEEKIIEFVKQAQDEADKKEIMVASYASAIFRNACRHGRAPGSGLRPARAHACPGHLDQAGKMFANLSGITGDKPGDDE